MAEKSRDDVLKKMLVTEPTIAIAENADGRGAAKGLTLDNMEDMAGGLRAAAEPIRKAKVKRDIARYKRQREDRAKNKPTENTDGRRVTK